MWDSSTIGATTEILTGTQVPSQLGDPNFNTAAQNILTAHVFFMKNNSKYWKQVEELAIEFYNLYLKKMLLKNVEIGSVAMVGDLMSLLKIACTQEQDPGFLIALANGSSKKLN